VQNLKHPRYTLSASERSSVLRYANRQEVEVEAEAEAEHLRVDFDFLSGIEARYMAGEFRVGSIAFDPATPDGNPTGYCLVGLYDDMQDRFVRTLPPVMYAAVGIAARHEDRPGG
jgi:hypothetical protein